jgi:hypothetical protein
MRMFFALCAHESYICIKVDATNAYANSPPPDQPTFVYIDEQYADWYKRSLYKGIFDGSHMLISRQVDDLAIGCSNSASIRKLVIYVYYVVVARIDIDFAITLLARSQTTRQRSILIHSVALPDTFL